MRIVNRAEFINLPENTLFSVYEPSCFHELQIKEDSIIHEFGNDFRSIGISSPTPLDATNSSEYIDILEEAEKTGVSFSLDFDVSSRDGCFVMDERYAIWEKEDIEKLIGKLKKCLDFANK